jgi:hypothetical protein
VSLSATQAAVKWEQAVRRAGQNYSGNWGYRTPREKYERLRERYVNGAVDLEGFTAEVVSLLLEGL